ncbi:MAG: class I SAM-dependent methyltransferase [Methylobacteriaceae bacterium]|nr:class I SAM-dependent methyltransferase [Methylobacteriaceae bacterium]
MPNAIQNFLSGFVKEGALEVALPGGKVMRFGEQNVADPPRIAMRDSKAQWELLRNPELAFGELYMDGRVDIVRGTLDDVLELVSRNARRQDAPAWLRLLFKTRIALRALQQRNDPRRARRNVAHHYDLGDELYALFLDDDWQYSCAYFEHDSQTLDEAQLAKKRHIAAKLAIEPGHSVLDIGCGWGGLGLYLARVAGADVTGVTLSKEQLETANRRAVESGLRNHARFELQDYRNVQGRFDRIVSVGMFEHVGVNYYRQFFEKMASCLNDDGIALLHTIGRTDGPGATSPWVDKYIFPGGYIPGLSEIIPHIERAGLMVIDIEVLRLHYAKTLQVWADRFQANREKAKAMYDERFCRMWEFYLRGARYVFLYEHHVVWQIQLAKDIYALPRITRDYIATRENELRQSESSAPDLRLANV